MPAGPAKSMNASERDSAGGQPAARPSLGRQQGREDPGEGEVLWRPGAGTSPKQLEVEDRVERQSAWEENSGQRVQGKQE